MSRGMCRRTVSRSDEAKSVEPLTKRSTERKTTKIYQAVVQILHTQCHGFKMMIKLRKFLKEQVIFLVIAFLPYYSGTAIVYAQSLPEGRSFFTEPLTVSRGKIDPSSPTAEIWQKSFWCDIVKKDWGWTECDGLDAFIVDYSQLIDTMIFELPNSEGRVSFEDWKSEDLNSEITTIEKSLKESYKVQSEKLGVQVLFKGWRVYPTLNEEKKILYYATDVTFDGEVSTNIKASLFDRQGYITVIVVPTSTNLDGASIEQIVLDVSDHYKPNASQDYSEFVTGDKVAAAGAIGVLATLVGVKYSKGIAAWLFVIGLAFVKKAWILIFLPLLWIRKLFRRK